MPIEVWTSDDTGTMVLMPESPDPDAPHGAAAQADAHRRTPPPRQSPPTPMSCGRCAP